MLLGLTTVALGGLTAVVGSVVDGQTAAADEARVAGAFDEGLRPTEQTGPNRVQVRFGDGRLTTVERQLRILTPTGVDREIDIGGLVYTSESARVTFVGGAVVRGRPGNSWLVREPPVTVTRDDSTFVVGAAAVNESGATVSGSGGVTARLRTNVTHAHTRLPTANYRVAIETATPGPLGRHFRGIGGRTAVTDLDGDGVPSVVVSVDGQQTMHLVVHAMRVEVAGG
nr:type IV pilin [Halomicroarcula limicola]